MIKQWASYSSHVHRCGASGSMRACHAAGPGSIHGRDKFPGWGFSSPVRQMSGSFRPPRSSNIIWPSLSSILIYYGRQWPKMLTRPKTSYIYMPIYIHTYIHIVLIINLISADVNLLSSVFLIVRASLPEVNTGRTSVL